jgi:hypothetical protein
MKPRAPPNIRVIPYIGMRLSGSFQPMSSAVGIMSMQEITKPLRAPLRLMFDVAMTNPATTQKMKAEMFALQSSF